MEDIRNAIAQMDQHEKDTEFLKRFLHLVIIGYTSNRDEMTKIVKSSPLVNTLLRILKGMGEQEEQLQTIITAILCVAGAMDKVREMVLRARNEGLKCGGNFIVWGEEQKRSEDMTNILQKSKEQQQQQQEQEITTTPGPEINKAVIIDEQIPLNFEELLNQMNQQENQIGMIPIEEKIIQSQLALKAKSPTIILEKYIFRFNNYFMNSQNSRRFGIIAEGAEIFNNIPISNKDFRAITYDEEDQPWITLEVDLREEIEHNTVRLFIGAEESPVIFMDVPKKMKIYLSPQETLASPLYFQIAKWAAGTGCSVELPIPMGRPCIKIQQRKHLKVTA
ncbi:MAG: hypothetical protein EZS28_025281 [Streblomastix strix]|uniref:Uncharacterized protein n=1 Tax=Streblomastix strix TaxID=222440 RepID=A0A5J4V9M1_9EUKA|nr:MAG: hypothetical protein EZS28_025281 [Streblomastix strix]